MCLIAVKHQGIGLPDKKKLENGYKNNPNGVGIAILPKGKNQIYIKKDFKDFDTFYTWANNNIGIEDIAVIHFRLATSGKVDIGNRHPFPITRNRLLLRKTNLLCNYAVAHNGILSDYSIKDKKYSDTQKFILDILAGVKYKLDNEAVLKLIRGYIGSDKLAIIDARQRKLILIGEYINDEGISWSNSGYKDDYKKWDKWDKSEWGCELCDNTKKVKYDEREKAFLCKKCRRGIKRKGWNAWLDELYAESYDDKREWDTITRRYKYYENI